MGETHADVRQEDPGEAVGLVQLFFLSRTVKYVRDGMDWKLEVEADARHAEILIKGMGFSDRTKGLDTPEEKPKEQDWIDGANRGCCNEKECYGICGEARAYLHGEGNDAQVVALTQAPANTTLCARPPWQSF